MSRMAETREAGETPGSQGPGPSDDDRRAAAAAVNRKRADNELGRQQEALALHGRSKRPSRQEVGS